MVLKPKRTTKRVVKRRSKAKRKTTPSVKIDKAGYAAYMKSPKWVAVKKRWWANNPRRECYVCGRRDAALDLHHRTYRNLGNEKDNDLVPVCRPCHQEIHQTHNARKDKSGGLWRTTGAVRKAHTKDRENRKRMRG